MAISLDLTVTYQCFYNLQREGKGSFFFLKFISSHFFPLYMNSVIIILDQNAAFWYQSFRLDLSAWLNYFFVSHNVMAKNVNFLNGLNFLLLFTSSFLNKK